MKKNTIIMSLIISIIFLVSLDINIRTKAKKMEQKVIEVEAHNYMAAALSKPKITASSKTYTSITINYSPSSNASHCEIHKASSLNGKYSIVATQKVATKYYVDKGLINDKANGKAYYYKIRCYKTVSGKKTYSSYSAIWEIVTKKLAKPTLTVKSTTTNTIKLGWTADKNADGYEIRRATSKNGTYTKVGTITAASASSTAVTFTDKGLTKGKTYYYKIRAYKKETFVNGSKKTPYTTYGSYSTIKSAATKK